MFYISVLFDDLYSIWYRCVRNTLSHALFVYIASKLAIYMCVRFGRKYFMEGMPHYDFLNNYG